MGRIEESARKRRKRENLQQAVLGVIGAAGIISVAMVAPNVFHALPHLMGRKNYDLKFKAKNAVGRLIIKGFVKRNAKGQLEISEAGRRHLAVEEARAAAPAQKKRRWDKQYRLGMFDIPQTRRAKRGRP